MFSCFPVHPLLSADLFLILISQKSPRNSALLLIPPQLENTMKSAPPDVAIPYDGKDHQWAQSKPSRLNGKLQSLAPTVAIIFLTVAFNGSEYGRRTYEWLNANYTPFEINLWFGFGITSVVYWIGGFIFMAADLWEPLHDVVKPFKVQPNKRITVSDYKKVCAVVLRNQVVVALPLLAMVSYFRPLRTTTPLPGAFETIWVWLVSMMAEGEFRGDSDKLADSPRSRALIHPATQRPAFSTSIDFSTILESTSTFTRCIISSPLPWRSLRLTARSLNTFFRICFPTFSPSWRSEPTFLLCLCFSAVLSWVGTVLLSMRLY